MKKLFTILLITPLLWACSSSDNDDVVNNNQTLTRVVTARLNYKLGELDDKSKVTVSDKRFNSEGLVIYNDTTNIGWYGDTKSRYIDTYKYDDNKNVLELKRIGKYADNSNVRFVYEYDTKGNKVKLSKYFDFGLAEIRKYFYKDGIKQPIKEEERDVRTPTIGYDHTYSYNSGTTIKESYRLDGSLFYRHIFSYDNYGNLLKQVDISPSGKEYVIEDISYKYDGKGRVTEIIWIKPVGDKHKAIYHYQENKLSLIEFVDAGTNEFKFIHTFEYIYS